MYFNSNFPYTTNYKIRHFAGKLNNSAAQILPLDHYCRQWEFSLLPLHFLPPKDFISLPCFFTHQFWYSAEYIGRHLRVLLDEQNKSPTHLDKKANTFLPDKQAETAQQTVRHKSLYRRSN